MLIPAQLVDLRSLVFPDTDTLLNAAELAKERKAEDASWTKIQAVFL